MKYALVTGAAMGIGKSIAIELARRSYSLILIDKDQEELLKTIEKIKHDYTIDIIPVVKDIADSKAARDIYNTTIELHKDLEVVVNNAGFGINGYFELVSIEEQLEIVDVNIKAQVSLTHIFLPVLRRNRRGYLLNVASTTAFQPVPFLAVYAASKAFVLSFNRSIQTELNGTGVHLSCLIPGSTDTNFVHRARMNERTRKIANRFNMSPELVARIAIDGLFKGKPEIIPGTTNWLNAFFPRFFPATFVAKIAARIYKPTDPHNAPQVVPLLPANEFN
jgi:hypothetical protein